MRLGKSIRLNKAFNVIGIVHGKRIVETLPAGAFIHVIEETNTADERMIPIQWRKRRFLMFAIDVEEHGEEL
jgi:hypothetical protein